MKEKYIFKSFQILKIELFCEIQRILNKRNLLNEMP